jgi:membrane-associated protease RseP (regulator of RpoE activity)
MAGLYRGRHRYWLHGLLLVLTLFTTAYVGARLAINFDANLPAFDIEQDFSFWREVYANPALLLRGLPFALTLLTILMAHELGHFLTCVFYRIDASLPYFLPAPTLIGTFGAFIKIRSPIFTRRVLFDVGVAGPLAGFLFLLPALGAGLAFSKVIPGIAEQGDIVLGTPIVLRIFEWIVFPGVAAADIYLHPVARAAWVGIFATALNLLPIGQLDGGHILYAFVGEKHKWMSRVFAASLIPLGLLFWHGWLLWAAFFFLTGMRRPAIYDHSPVGYSRWKLGLLAVLILILSFSPDPIRTGLTF